MLNHAMQGVRQLINHNKHPHNTADANPFGKALDTPDDIVDELTRNAIKLNPLIKRRIIKGLEGIPSTLQLGWAQLPQTQGKAFSIGLFTDNNHFAQIALADSKARVFAGTNPEMDVQDLEPRFIFVKEETLTLPDGPRFGHATNGAPKMVRASQGGVVGRMPGGRMMWLASWLKVGNRYTLEQMRANLPETMRFDLEYRDAITIGILRSLHAAANERATRGIRHGQHLPQAQPRGADGRDPPIHQRHDERTLPWHARIRT